MSDILTIAAGFAASYIANNIPTIKNLGMRYSIMRCYNRARKQWKCERVRERYEGKAFKHLNDLKRYVCGNNQRIDSELEILLARWVIEMQNDSKCSSYLMHWKIDSISQDIKRNLELEETLLEKAETIDTKICEINHKVDSLSESTSRMDGNITEIKDLLQRKSGENKTGVNGIIAQDKYNALTKIKTEFSEINKLVYRYYPENDNQGISSNQFSDLLFKTKALSEYVSKNSQFVSKDLRDNIDLYTHYVLSILNVRRCSYTGDPGVDYTHTVECDMFQAKFDQLIPIVRDILDSEIQNI